MKNSEETVESSGIQQNSVSRLAHDLDDLRISRTDDILLSNSVDFKSMLLPEYILKGLTAAQFLRPSPIQLQAIPLLRLGLDLIVQGKSGTGKTLVIGLAVLETVKVEINRIQALIIAPTREIALQIKDFLIVMSSGIPDMKIRAFVGGLSKIDDKINLTSCHVAVGTPGRLQDLVASKLMQLQYVRLFVLDEADKLMERDLFKQIKTICQSLPAKRQTILCSATFQNPLQEYVVSQMKDPFWVSSEGATRLRAGKLQPDSSIPMVLLGVKHFLKEVPFISNINMLLKFKLDEILIILSKVSFSQCLVFSNFQSRAETICNQLVANGWPASSIRGQDEQSQRMAAIAALKEFRCRVLLTTDVTARGIDIKGVDLVVNLDIPYDSATYLHRSGRAGRFGSHGTVITLASTGKEMARFSKIITDIPSAVVFYLPLDLNIIDCDDSAFKKVNIRDCKDLINGDKFETCKADVTSESVRGEDLHGDLHSQVLENSEGIRERTLKAAKEHLSLALNESQQLKKCPFSTYDAIESMFTDWVADGCPTDLDTSSSLDIRRQGWWTSAEIILLEANCQLEHLKEGSSRAPVTKQTVHSPSDETPQSSAKKTNMKSKRKLNQHSPAREKQFCEVQWEWDDTWNMYYTWDQIEGCCYFFNPWTQIYYKWKSNKCFEWNEELQSYTDLDSDSSRRPQQTKESKHFKLMESNGPGSNQVPPNANNEPYWSWFMLWSKQIEQIRNYILYTEYFNNLRDNHR